MASFTKLIALYIVFVFHNYCLDVYASYGSRIHSVKVKLNNLEAQVKTINDKAESEIASLEKYISSLNSSANTSNDGGCSLPEARTHMKMTIKQTTDEVLALERENEAVISKIEREKERLRQTIRTWEKTVGTISSQMNNLLINQDNLEKKFQTIGECINSNDDKKRTREISEDLSLTSETMRNNYITRKPCLDGWLLFNKHCYYYDKNVTLSFSNAREYCRKSNAHVADVESKSESKFIFGLTGDVFTWIGVTDQAEEDVWKSERTNNVVAYTNWLRGEPDGDNRQNCAVLGYKHKRFHKWIDDMCTVRNHFVCKTEATPVK